MPLRLLLLLLWLWGLQWAEVTLRGSSLLSSLRQTLRGRPPRGSCTSAGSTTARSAKRCWRPQNLPQAWPVTVPSICMPAGTTRPPTPLLGCLAPGICPGSVRCLQALSSASVAVMASGDLGETTLSVRIQRRMGLFRTRR
uniref:Gastric inhibitory polypeptide receptor n=1 Tax=Mus musculus TaxID=10090 RepID=A0A0U1RP73_MOUSE